MIIGSRGSWPVAKTSGPLVRVQVSPGRYVKMYEDEAREKGLWPPPEAKEAGAPEVKAVKAARNKRREPTADKGVSDG